MPGLAYIFLDEGGNLDFSPKGTRYFTLTAVSQQRPFPAVDPLISLKWDLIETGLDLQCFHAAEDTQRVRDQVFDVIRMHLASICIDALIVEKPKTGPALQKAEQFFPRMLGYLLKYALQRPPARGADEVLVFTDTIPVNKKRRAIEKALKKALAAELPSGVKYRLFHHYSRSCMGLQVADYCNWAIFRKWERADTRSYDLIRTGVRSEFEIFRTGTRLYYAHPGQP
jgi:hypothetical protein